MSDGDQPQLPITALSRGQPEDPEIFSEYLDFTRFPAAQYADDLVRYLRARYAARKPAAFHVEKLATLWRTSQIWHGLISLFGGFFRCALQYRVSNPAFWSIAVNSELALACAA